MIKICTMIFAITYSVISFAQDANVAPDNDLPWKLLIALGSAGDKSDYFSVLEDESLSFTQIGLQYQFDELFALGLYYNVAQNLYGPSIDNSIAFLNIERDDNNNYYYKGRNQSSDSFFRTLEISVSKAVDHNRFTFQPGINVGIFMQRSSFEQQLFIKENGTNYVTRYQFSHNSEKRNGVVLDPNLKLEYTVARFNDKTAGIYLNFGFKFAIIDQEISVKTEDILGNTSTLVREPDKRNEIRTFAFGFTLGF